MRVLGLDVGDKKIGISLSHSTRSIAQALMVYRRSNLENDMKELKRVVDELGIEEIVICLPNDLSCTIGKKATEVMAFAEKIRIHTSINTVLWMSGSARTKQTGFLKWPR